jgi:hypothetical protein
MRQCHSSNATRMRETSTSSAVTYSISSISCVPTWVVRSPVQTFPNQEQNISSVIKPFKPFQTFSNLSNLFKPFQTFPNLLRSRYYDCRLLISRNPQDRFISTSQRARWREADRRNPSRPRSPHQRLLHFPLLSPASRRLSSLCERARTSSSGRPRWRKTPNSWATWR